jgi:hypothetical protein
VPGFLYFIPRLEGTHFNPEKLPPPLKTEKLDKIFRNASVTQKGPPLCGPEGIRGAIVAPTSEHYQAVDVGYDSSLQNWRKCGDTHWLGVWKDRLPDEKSLRRERIVPGELIEINKQQWTIPLVGPAGIYLPSAFDVAEDGQWQAQVDDEYRELMKASERVMKMLDPAVTPDPTEAMEEQLQFCSDVLSVNYRVSNREVGWLGMLKADTIRKIITTSLGIEIVSREKTEAATAPNG